MANSTARMLLKTGKSFPQLLRSRLVGQPNISIYSKEQQLLQSLVNPTQKIFEQKPILGDGFNFVDFVLGKDKELRMEQGKSSAVAAVHGRRVVSSDEDEDEDFGDEEIEGFGDDDRDFDGDFDDDDDDDEDEDGDDHGVRV